ncbi:retrovirus-related pol polyprotein from transposon TNT 1-94 [Tanacetum coccineum]
MDEMETINIELEHSVAKLLSTNERLHKEIEHLKKIYKDQFDSIKKTRALSIEYYDSLIAQLNSKSMRLQGKLVLDNATTITNATTIAPGMFKLDIEPLSRCLNCSLVSGLRILKTYDKEPLSAHELRLKHNLFYVGQFYDLDLEVAFRKNTFFIQNLDSVDLLSGSRDTNLYIISLDDMLKTSSICLLLKASKIKSWLWHHRLSHLNFGTLNKLAIDDLVRGIPKLKFKKDHLCSACALGKSKKSSHQHKAEDTNQEKLYLLHIDLYGSMRVESINGKKYILVIVDDYS